MNATKKPSAVTGLRRGMAVPQIRSDESIGHPEDIGRLVPERRPRPEKPAKIRFTLDLDPDRHRYLKDYAAQIEASASEVIRELLDEMQADGDLRDRIRVRIWTDKR